MSKFRKLKAVPKQELLQILTSNNYEFSVVLRNFNIAPRDGRARKYLRDILDEFGIRKTIRKGKSTFDLIGLTQAVKQSLCYSDVIKQLGLTTHGSNFNTIRKYIANYHIDVSHFDIGAAWKRNKRSWIFEEIFCENSKFPRPRLHEASLRFNILEYKCAECPIVDTHNNKPISLTLDHKNGTTDDNRVENLRWLCPNCHSQTPTYCGKNIGKQRV